MTVGSVDLSEKKYSKGHSRLPATLALTAITLTATWMGFENGGYFVADWGLIGLAVAVILLFGTATGAFRAARVRYGVIALALFGAYTAWTFASILWAPNRGEAWSGASLTLLYLLVVLTTVALIIAGASRRWALAGAVIGPAVAAAFTVLAFDSNLGGMFENGRLEGTVGYYNGQAAFLLVSFWTAMYLAGSPRVNPVLRAAVLASSVINVEVAVLTQSRGGMVAVALSLLVFFLLSGQRVRGLLALAPVIVALLIAFPGLNQIYLAFSEGGDPTAVAGRVTPVIWLTTLGAGLYGLLWGLLDRGWQPSRTAVRVAGSIALAGVVLVAAAGMFVAVERVGNPAEMAQERWEAFKSNDRTGEDQSRYLSASGQGRFALWEVAWEDFVSHPVLGVGTNNYEATYYQRREQTSTGSVRQPHTLPLEVLAERGIVGGVLFFGFLVACAATALRQRFGGLTPEAQAQVGALLASVTYWFVHSSVDWFWQLPAVTLPAMVYLGMLLTPWQRRASSPLRTSLRIAGVALALVAIMVVAPLYAADRYLERSFSTAEPAESMVNVERAQRINPLGYSLFRREAELATELGEPERAERAYERVIDLNPQHYAPYALLAGFYEEEGERRRALTLYGEALTRNPLSADLNRQAIRLLPDIFGENATFRFMDRSGAGSSLDLQVLEGSPEARRAVPQQAPPIPSGVDGVLYIWPVNVSAPITARDTTGSMRVAFIDSNGKVISIGSGVSAEPPRPYRMALVTDRDTLEAKGVGQESQLVVSESTYP